MVQDYRTSAKVLDSVLLSIPNKHVSASLINYCLKTYFQNNVFEKYDENPQVTTINIQIKHMV